MGSRGAAPGWVEDPTRWPRAPACSNSRPGVVLRAGTSAIEATIIEHFGPQRCMLGSHLPISRLSSGFEPLYDAYDELLADLSPADQDSLFGATATSWFGFDRLALPVRDGDASRDRTPRETALPGSRKAST